MPAFQVEVVDHTGAGDVYHAGFLGGLFLERSLEESAHFGSVIAAKSVTGYGRGQYPTQEDLEEFFHIRSEPAMSQRTRHHQPKTRMICPSIGRKITRGILISLLVRPSLPIRPD